MSPLCDLPDEIFLEIVRSLDVIRSFETQATAFKRKHIERERQRENHLRKQTLHSLCLTSHRIRSLSIPTLYASFCICATRSGLRQLQLLHRTISAPNHALGQTKHLAEHFLYIENRLADFKGDSLGDDEVFRQESFATYTRLLSDLTLRATNIEHICVVSVEFDGVADNALFWDHILSRPAHVTLGGLGKLKFLFTQFNMLYNSPQVSICHRLLQHISLLPELSTLQVSGAQLPETCDTLELRPDGLQKICRLDLTECMLKIHWVADLLFACKRLQHFSCRWSYAQIAESGSSDLHDALLAHTDTLETLALDWRAADFDTSIAEQLGSLRGMKKLRTLQLCEIGFPSDCAFEGDYPFQYAEYSLAELLPESLEHLTLDTVLGEDDLTQAEVLWQFSGECGALVPSLRTLCIKVNQEVPPENLTGAFRDVGVELHIEPSEPH